MFLLHALAVFTVAFWISAVVAEVMLRTPGEAALSPGVRVGFGFMASLAFFCAAWQFASIGVAWLAGVILLAAYAAGMPRPLAQWIAPWRGYARSYAMFLAGAAIFFLPLLLSWTFGPFTEGGGDISIYADTAKYLVDHGLTEAGLKSPDTSSPLMNPPLGDYATYRLLAAGNLSRFLYTPYAMFSFLAGTTNYAVFHGVQCLAYVFIIAACWDFLRRYGRAAAILGAGCVVASHGLISVFYNTYSAHAISLASCALVLAAIPRVRLVSWAGVRTYGCAILVAWVCYGHYLGVLLPIVLAAAGPLDREAARRPRFPTVAAAAAALVLLASLASAATQKSWALLASLVRDALAPAAGLGTNPYLGEPAPIWSAKWLAFAFGVVSQQHLAPFVTEIGIVDVAIRAAVAAAIASTAASLLMTARVMSSGALGDLRRVLSLYSLALLTIAIHLYLARKSLYTQAKGAQNVLPLVYTAMALPVAFAARLRSPGRFDRVARRALIAAAALFIALMAVPRAAYLLRFALGFDRTSILEPSFFDEAGRIRRADPRALVLVEPRVSADLYAANQPFFGGRMLPTRYIILQTRDQAAGGPNNVALAPDFIEPADLPHLWMLRPDREPRWTWLGKLPYVSGSLPRPSYRTTWHGERLADAKRPVLVLSAGVYERTSERTAATASPVGFAPLRNGVVSIFVPASPAGSLTVELRAASAAQYPALEAEIRHRLRAGEFGADAAMTASGGAIILGYALPAAPGPAFRVVARCQDRCSARVRFEGNDLE